MFLANAPASDGKDLLSELELMKKLKTNPHVIKLIGCVTESGEEEAASVILRVILHSDIIKTIDE